MKDMSRRTLRNCRQMPIEYIYIYIYIQTSLGVSGGTKCQNARTWNTAKRGNAKGLGERGGSGGAAEGRARRRRRNGEWATRRWRRGERAAPQTTERRSGRTSRGGAEETTQGGARPARIQQRRPKTGRAQTGDPKRGAANKRRMAAPKDEMRSRMYDPRRGETVEKTSGGAQGRRRSRPTGSRRSAADASGAQKLAASRKLNGLKQRTQN
jgi:hypothetical protein